MTEENWRPIPGFEGFYSASDKGRIRSEYRKVPVGKTGKTITVSEKILKPSPGKHGHLYTRLWRENTEHPFLVHRLIAMTFLGPQPEDKPYVLHGDGNPSNNNVENLRWGNQSENMRDAVKHGTQRNQNTGKLRCIRGHEMVPRSSGYGRRCVTCTYENAVKRSKVRTGLPDGDKRHGTSNGYKHWNCKCDPCKAAKSAEDRALRERKKAARERD